MDEMTAAERRSFLLKGTRTGKLATTRPDGRPHVAPIWFTLDGDTLIFTTWHTTVKAKNLEANPQAALCVDEETPPFAFVLVEGGVTIEKEAPDMLRWTTEIAGRYMGAGQAEAFGKRNAVAGEWLIRLKADKIIARKGIAD